MDFVQDVRTAEMSGALTLSQTLFQGLAVLTPHRALPAKGRLLPHFTDKETESQRAWHVPKACNELQCSQRVHSTVFPDCIQILPCA